MIPRRASFFWTYPLTPSVRSGMTIPSPRQTGNLLFLTSFYNGSLMLRADPDQPTPVWQSKKVSETDTDGLHSVMATPLLEAGYLHSPCSYGQCRCLKVATGERIWETFATTTGKSTRWVNAFIVKNGNRYSGVRTFPPEMTQSRPACCHRPGNHRKATDAP